MKRLLSLVMAVLILTGGCALKKDVALPLQEQQNKEGIILYTREKIDFHMEKDYNPYQVNYSENGVFYYSNTEDQYNFYFQPYLEQSDPACIFGLKGGYVQNLYAVKREDGMHFCVLWMEDGANIYEFDANGNTCGKIVLGEEMYFQGKFPVLLALKQGGYVIGLQEKAYWISADGNVNSILSINGGVIRNLTELKNGRIYVVYETTDMNPSGMQIAELDLKSGQLGNSRVLPGNNEHVFPWEEEHLIYINNDYVCVLGEDEESDERFIDLRKQSFLASQIQGIFGNREELLIVSANTTSEKPEVKVFRLTPRGDESGDDVIGDREESNIAGNAAGKKAQEEEYAPDGRRILRVALSSAEEYAWEIEHLAKKYNQDSDDAYIETYFYDGTLEDHLGRGNRPDIVMLHDQAAIGPLVERGVLTDFIPLYENQDRYSLEDVLPKVREALSVGDGMYAMTRRFELLLRSSDGTEWDEKGECTTMEYLRWYDAYLEKNELQGMGDLENLFFGIMADFYDGETGKAYFLSDDFKELMREYKALKTKYREGTGLTFDINDTGAEYTLRKISNGPRWVSRLIGNNELVVLGNTLEGLPTNDGKKAVYMRLQQPLAIMSTSNCKQEAFDFILYACRNRTPMAGANGYTVTETKPDRQTYADFWVFEEYLKEDIWENDKAYLVLPTVTGPYLEFYLTKERCDMLRNLMDQAVGVTKEQNDIYGMYLEEMDGYLNGNKDLEDCCEIMQNRVSLYLAER